MTPTGLAIVIFSKDRPLQLDATIRSLGNNCDDLGSADIRVLYVASTPAFAAGYRILANELPGVRFHRETDFRSDLVALVDGSAHVLFIVDDTLFVGSVSLAQAMQVLDENPACLGFSFRLGRNTTYCYPIDKPQRLPAFEELAPGVLTFDWAEAEHDFGYPLELSSSLYRTSDILPLLEQVEYQNPNSLESNVAEVAVSFRATRPRLACYPQSRAFSVPANVAQTAWRNRAEDNPSLTTTALAQVFATGQRLDVARYEGFVANACHQEVEFAYRKDPGIPSVSVIMPCYEQAEYLPDAVASVVGQTFTDWELVIVDDGSPDDTVHVARNLADRSPGLRIRLLSGPNRGVAGARNRGIEAALGRYILPLDADDMLAPAMLAATVQVLESRPDVAIAYTDQRHFGTVDRVVRLAAFEPFLLPSANQFGYCSLYRREVWEAVGGYNPNMVHGNEDWDFWLGAVEHGYRAARVPEPLFAYRVRSGTRSSSAREHEADLLRQLRVNHPRLYRPGIRARRVAVRVARAAVRRLRKAVIHETTDGHRYE